MKFRIRVGGTIYAYVPELGRKAPCEYMQEKFVDIPDEEFLNKKGYWASNHAFYITQEIVDTLKPSVWDITEIYEDGLTYNMPYFEEPFNTVEELRKYLSSKEIIDDDDTDFKEEREKDFKKEIKE